MRQKLKMFGIFRHMSCKTLKKKNQKIYVTRGYGKFQVCQPGNAAMTNSSQLHAACPFSLQIKVLRVKTEI